MFLTMQFMLQGHPPGNMLAQMGRSEPQAVQWPRRATQWATESWSRLPNCSRKWAKLRESLVLCFRGRTDSTDSLIWDQGAGKRENTAGSCAPKGWSYSMDRKLATFFSVIKDLAIKVLEKEYYDVLLHNNNFFSCMGAPPLASTPRS